MDMNDNFCEDMNPSPFLTYAIFIIVDNMNSLKNVYDTTK